MAMMLAAGFNTETQNILRCEAISTASKIGDSLVRQGQVLSSYEQFYGKQNPILKHLIQFGRVGYVTDRTPIKKKWVEKSHKCIMVGYAEDHSPDTYRMFNPETKSIFLTRDVKWADWSRPDPISDLTQFFDRRPGVDTTPLPPPVPISDSHVVPDDIPDPSPLFIGEEHPTVTIEELEESEDNENDRAAAPERAMTRSQMRNRIQEKLSTNRYPTRSYFKAQGGDKVSDLEEASPMPTLITNDEEDPDRVVEQEQVCNTAIVSDPGEPKNWKDAFSRGWHDPMASEVMNFVNRDAWIKVERSMVTKLGRNPIGTKWVFKTKKLHDGTTKRKARCVVQGFKQIPGVDFTESFSPVATDTSIRLLVAMFLFYKKNSVRPTKTPWVLEMFDVEAAFLNAEIDQRMFVEFPHGMEELGFIGEDEREHYCIELNKTMYGDIAAPLRWMRTITRTMVEDLGMTQSEVDPCIFYKKDSNGNLLLLCAVFVDDTLITGLEDEVNKFYKEFQEHYNIEILGKLSKHLGVTWTWEEEDGDTVLKASMPSMEEEIIVAVEEAVGKTVKEQPTPGLPGRTLEKHEGEPVNIDAY